ncbi:hypothetical protein AWH62_12125 [Maricaulis sp. W15]|uniref:type II toxin-antitoxin system RelE/ParE family toxin n=1 Tax=Maricaulis sp. W15 TaxID=1772333 RepID=UPI00095C5963|nr:type II toxin-antitoxin system RelE/ParE family toxin [Maricaulis sp. W15]OLF71876.1 hypothetical protein AWH62_12125 [Maricaulis sp. W15]
MAAYRLSAKADADIDAIYEYSILNFGLATASTYIDELFARFDLLADNPGWGNDYTHIAPGLRRYEHTRHPSITRASIQAMC